MAGDPPAPAALPLTAGDSKSMKQVDLFCNTAASYRNSTKLTNPSGLPMERGHSCCHTETGAERLWKPVLYHSPSPGSSGTLGRPPNPSETPCPLFYQWPCCHQPCSPPQLSGQNEIMVRTHDSVQRRRRGTRQDHPLTLSAPAPQTGGQQASGQCNMQIPN